MLSMSKKVESLSLKEAQRIVMAKQMLDSPKKSPLKVIEHLGYVQIDTISVVERAHHHVFWSRCPKYQPSDLDKLVRNRKVFEYWSHAASFLPMRDYRFTLPMKKEFSKRESSWYPKDEKLMKRVLKRIKKEGPLRSKDFQREDGSKSSGWWDWKPAKKALERLFFEGKLEVSRREGFQKVYDLPENVIPSSVDTSMPSQKDYIRFLIQRTLRHHGLATAKEIGYLRKKNVVDAIRKELAEMLNSKEVVAIKIQNIEEPYFGDPKDLQSIPRIGSSLLILSPFDNFVIQRNKLNLFFNFDYQIECYLPEKKRKYGYFTLPIFKGVTPVGRVDCKAERDKKRLVVQSLHYEKKDYQDQLQKKIESKLKLFSKFNLCTEVFIR